MALLVLLLACNPHDAELTNSTFVALLSDGTSDNLANLEKDDDREVSVQEDVPVASINGFTPIDCRSSDLIEDYERLPDAEDCPDEAPEWFTWINQYGYWKKIQQVEASRVEVLQNNEGDIQMTVHFKDPVFGDSRFGWVINPDFQPVYCEGTDSGAEISDIEGDWLDHWSEDQTDSEGNPVTMYHVNASAYQVNPSDLGDYWYFPSEWSAAAAFGRYGEEGLSGRSTSYTEGFLYDVQYEVPLYFEGGDEYRTINLGQSYEEYVDNVAEVVEGNVDLEAFAGVTPEDFPLDLVVEDNGWRPEGQDAVGLYEWVGVNASWVKIHEGADFTPGKGDKKFSGEFQLQLDGTVTGSHIFVNGKFNVTNIREDKTYGVLEEEKREQSGQGYCVPE